MYVDNECKGGIVIKLFGGSSRRKTRNPRQPRDAQEEMEVQEELETYDKMTPATPANPPEPTSTSRKKKKAKKPNRGMRVLAIILCVLLFFEALYCFVVFTDITAIKDLREMYISTALSTMSHRWLATKLLPNYMVTDVEIRDALATASQAGQISDRTPPPVASKPTTEPVETTEPDETTQPGETTEPPEITTSDPDYDPAEEAFYELYWELNRTSFEDYLDAHPEVLDNGWENIYINEAGLDDEGTEIYTAMGEQVLAIDAANQILLVRVKGTGYLGVLAIAKDPAQLRVEASAGMGSYGQYIGTIAENSGGVLSITGSGFIDPNGMGNGGLLAGYCRIQGKSYGNHYGMYGYKRIELTEDNWMFIADAQSYVADDVTDAVEFSPALIIDGELAVGGFYDWNANNPRACIGQSEYGEILMLVIEGRMISRSIGTDVEECANILKRHKGYNAMNLDGGASAHMWFDGEYITVCSNGNPSGRLVPNAWVYGNYE